MRTHPGIWQVILLLAMLFIHNIASFTKTVLRKNAFNYARIWMVFVKEKFLKTVGDHYLSSLEFLALLFICGRFYYLMGFVGHLKPTAPMPFLFIKDVLLGLIILSFFLLPKASAPKFFKVLLSVWLVSFATIACVHFFAKSFSDWGQHYVRNVLLVLAATPALYRWASMPKIFDLNKFLFWACGLNIVAAILQEQFLPETMLGLSRPLGFVGDPISLTTIVLIFFAVIVLSEMSYLQMASIALVTGYVLNMAASISACLSASVAAAPALFFLFGNLDKYQFRKLLIKSSLCLCFLIGGFAVPHKIQYDNLTERIKVLYLSYVQKRKPQTKADDLLYDSLKSGRTQSLAITKESISSEKIERNMLAFWIGEYESPLYRRVDSTPAVLIINWGFGLFLLFYLSLLFIIICLSHHFIRNKSKMTSDKLRANALSIYVFFLILILSFFNSVIYRSPINFLFILASIFLFKNLDKEKIEIDQNEN